MSLIYKYCSSKEILEQVFRDSGRTEDINLADVYSFIMECCDLIGYPLQYIPKVIGYVQDDVYNFDNYRVPLPKDFYLLQMGGVLVDGYQAKVATSSFHYLMGGECCNLNTLQSNFGDIIQDNFGNLFDTALGSTGTNTTGEISYQVNDGYITFNVKTGKACIAYWAYPIDAEGFPMIPDTTKYKRAVSSYLIYKMDYIAWRTGEIPDKVYKESEKQKDWDMGSARSATYLLDPNQTANLKKGLIRLLPLFGEENNSFSKFGSQEGRNMR